MLDKETTFAVDYSYNGSQYTAEVVFPTVYTTYCWGAQPPCDTVIDIAVTVYSDASIFLAVIGSPIVSANIDEQS